MSSLLSCPDEILLDIAENIKERPISSSFNTYHLGDLAHLARTSRRLNRIATLPLYKHVTVRPHGMILLESTLRQDPGKGLGILYLEIVPSPNPWLSEQVRAWRNRQTAGNLPTMSAMITSLLNKCRNLREFTFAHNTLHDDLYGGPIGLQPWAGYLHALAALTKLHTLRIGHSHFEVTPPPPPLLAVTHLHLCMPFPTDKKILGKLFFPGLQCLTLSDANMEQIYPGSDFGLVALSEVKQLSLGRNLSTRTILRSLRRAGIQMDLLEVSAKMPESPSSGSTLQLPPFKIASSALRLRLIYKYEQDVSRYYGKEDDSEFIISLNHITSEITTMISFSGLKVVEVIVHVAFPLDYEHTDKWERAVKQQEGYFAVQLAGGADITFRLQKSLSRSRKAPIFTR